MAYGLLFDYLNGQCIEAYKYFGAHFETREVKEIITIPLKKDPNKTKKSSRKKLIEGVVFRLYAPAASDVSVIGDWNSINTILETLGVNMLIKLTHLLF